MPVKELILLTMSL